MFSPFESERPAMVSPDDDVRWRRICEGLSTARITSDVYNLLGLESSVGMIIGPYVPPNDELGIQLLHSVGPFGSLFSVDPRGDTKGAGIIVGEGNSQQYLRDSEVLRGLGFPLGQFHWLGTESSIGHIPPQGFLFDFAADHWTLEFVGSDGRVDETFMQTGIMDIVSSIRIGGLFVHHSNDNEASLAAYAFGKDQSVLYAWFQSIGLRLCRVTLQQDSYVFPLPESTLDDFFATTAPEQIFSSDAARTIRLMSQGNGALVIPESTISYPSRDVLIGQRIW